MHLRQRLEAGQYDTQLERTVEAESDSPQGFKRLAIFLVLFGFTLFGAFRLNSYLKPPRMKPYKNDLTSNEWHVAVVGGGLAGCSAAVEALRRGAYVTLIDKVKLGGNSAKATSGINAAGTKLQAALGVADTPELFQGDILTSGQGGSRHDLAASLAARSADALIALEEIYGKTLTDLTILGGHAVPRTHRLPSTDKPVPLGFTVMNAFRAMLNPDKWNGRLSLLEGTKLTNFEIDQQPNGIARVVKLILETQEKKTAILKPDAVVLATGGFAADLAGPLLTKFCPGCVFTTNGNFATGDVQVLAEKHGVATIDLDQIQLHPTGFLDPKDPLATTKFLCPEAVRGSGAILISSEGKRFVNELGRRDQVTRAIQEFGGGILLWGFAEANKEEYSKIGVSMLVMDNSVRSRVGALNFDFYRSRGLIATYESLSDLAETYRWNLEEFKKQILDYQEAAINGEDEFERTNFATNFSEILDGTSPIFTALVTPATHYTMGGLKVNSQLQAELTNGKTILNMFAAGELMGGLHGKNRLGGTGMTEGATFGRLSGRNAANLARINNSPFGLNDLAYNISVDNVGELKNTGILKLAFQSLYEGTHIDVGAPVTVTIAGNEFKAFVAPGQDEIISGCLVLKVKDASNDFFTGLRPGMEGTVQADAPLEQTDEL